MKIWLDDERPVPDETWTLVKNVSDLVDILHSCEWIDKWDRLNEIKVLKNAEGNEYCLHIVDGRNTQESGYTTHEMLRKCAHMMNAKV